MKTLQCLAIIIFLCCMTSRAQNADVPDWGVPVTSARYYYIPDIQTYYDTTTNEYIYLNDGMWERSSSIPSIYRNYDFHNGRKIVINNYSGNAPYAFYNIHRVKYVPSRPNRTYVKRDPNQNARSNTAKSRGSNKAQSRGSGRR